MKIVLLISASVISLAFLTLRSSRDEASELPVRILKAREEPTLVNVEGSEQLQHKLGSVASFEQSAFSRTWIEMRLEYAHAMEQGDEDLVMDIEFRAWNLLDETSGAELAVEYAGELFDQSPLGLLMLRRWAELDRDAASRWLRELPSTSIEQASALIVDWIDEDIKGLYVYLDTLLDGEWKNHFVTAAATEMASVASAPEALYFLERAVGSHLERESLYVELTLQWAIEDSVSAFEWAKLPKNYSRSQNLLAAACVGYAYQDPSSAMHEAQENLIAGPEFDRTLFAIIEIWETKDREALETWRAELTSNELRFKVDECLQHQL